MPENRRTSGITVSEGGLEPPCPFGALAPQASASARFRHGREKGSPGADSNRGPPIYEIGALAGLSYRGTARCLIPHLAHAGFIHSHLRHQVSV